MIIRKIKAGKRVIRLINLAYEADQPVLLVGKHGVGKSQLVEAAALALKIGFITRDLSIMEPPDLTGIPRIDTDGRTVYAPPKFLPDDGKGLIIFEELNRCPVYMRAPCLQLLTTRRLNDYQLPSGWLPVAAINPSSEDYDVEDLDPALRARFMQVEIVPDAAEWVHWAQGNCDHD